MDRHCFYYMEMILIAGTSWLVCLIQEFSVGPCCLWVFDETDVVDLTGALICVSLYSKIHFTYMVISHSYWMVTVALDVKDCFNIYFVTYHSTRYSGKFPNFFIHGYFAMEGQISKLKKTAWSCRRIVKTDAPFF